MHIVVYEPKGSKGLGSGAVSRCRSHQDSIGFSLNLYWHCIFGIEVSNTATTVAAAAPAAASAYDH